MNKTLKFLNFLLAILVCVVAQAQSVGWLQVSHTATSEGAELYVDGKYVTDVPAKVALSAGKHNIVLKKSLHLDYMASMNLKEGETSTLSVEMEKNYNYVSVVAPLDAQIVLDSKILGAGKWSGNLECGEYQLEARKKGYKPSTMTLTVTTGRSIAVTLPKQVPIMGYISVDSNVQGCSVYVDERYMGKTPLKTEVCIGDHCVKVKMPNGQTKEQMVTVDEGKVTKLDFAGKNMYPISYTTNVKDAKFQIDGSIYEYHSLPKTLEEGRHNVRVVSPKYKDCKRNVYVKNDSNIEHFKLREYAFGRGYKQGSVYANLGYQVCRCPGFEVGGGFCVYGFNVEMDYGIGFNAFNYTHVEEVRDYYSTSYNYLDYKYRSNYCTIKFGYGIPVGTRFRALPQVGVCKHTFVGKDLSGLDYYDKYAEVKSNLFYVGGRIDVAVNKWLSIYTTPAYITPSKSSEPSEILQSMLLENDYLAKYLKGFSISIGVSFNLNLWEL